MHPRSRGPRSPSETVHRALGKLYRPGRPGPRRPGRSYCCTASPRQGHRGPPLSPSCRGRLPIILPDAPGHGGSSDVRADLWRTADLLVDTVGRPALWVGYSMGGRTALHVALAHPDQVEGLVLISTTAGIDAPEEREARRAADDALAARIQTEGTEAFLDWWLAQPLFGTLPPERRWPLRPAWPTSQMAWHRACASPAPVPRNPSGTGSPELRERSLPVLLVAGELDGKYSDQAARMASAIGPSARVLIVQRRRPRLPPRTPPGRVGCDHSHVGRDRCPGMLDEIGPASAGHAASSEGQPNSE